MFADWHSLDLAEDERVMLEFAEKLTFHPSGSSEDDIKKLRSVGFTDENILDIVAMTAYRNMLNRLHDGIGLTADLLRDRLGDEFVDAVAAAKEGSAAGRSAR